MKPKDLLDHLEKVDRTEEMLEYRGEGEIDIGRRAAQFFNSQLNQLQGTIFSSGISQMAGASSIAMMGPGIVRAI